MNEALHIVIILNGGIMRCPVVIEAKEWNPVSGNNIST